MSTAMGMDMIGTGLNTFTEGLRATIGGMQMRDAMRALDKLKRPKMTVPGGVGEATEIMEKIARRTMIPGQEIITGDIKASTAAGIESALQAGGPEAYGAITEMVSNEQEAISGLYPVLAEMNLQGERGVAASKLEEAQWDLKAWEWNEMRKWAEKKYELEKLKSEGMANAFTAMDQAMSMWGDTMSGMGGSSDMLGGLLGGGGGGEESVPLAGSEPGTTDWMTDWGSMLTSF